MKSKSSVVDSTVVEGIVEVDCSLVGTELDCVDCPSVDTELDCVDCCSVDTELNCVVCSSVDTELGCVDSFPFCVEVDWIAGLGFVVVINPVDGVVVPHFMQKRGHDQYLMHGLLVGVLVNLRIHVGLGFLVQFTFRNGHLGIFQPLD